MKPFTRADKETYAEMQQDSSRELIRRQRAVSVIKAVGGAALGSGLIIGSELSPFPAYIAAAGGAYLVYRSTLVSSFINDILAERHPEPVTEEE